jgi:hypothetical protein
MPSVTYGMTGRVRYGAIALFGKVRFTPFP